MPIDGKDVKFRGYDCIIANKLNKCELND